MFYHSISSSSSKTQENKELELGIRYTSNVIGLLISCSEPVSQGTRYGVRSLVNINITDGSETAAVALWGSHADNFQGNEYIQMGRQDPVVILFVGVTASMYNGRLTLQGAAICRWYVNPVLPETTLLRQRYGNAVGQPQLLGLPAHAAAPHDSNVAELSKLDNANEILGNKYLVTAKIKSLQTNEPWWYMACNLCKRRSKPYGDSFRCMDTSCSCTIAVPRYKLAFVATHPTPDENGEEPMIDIICFGPLGNELTGVAVDALIDPNATNTDYIPEQITRLYGKIYRFELSVPRGSMQRDTICYKIDSIVSIGESSNEANPTQIDKTNETGVAVQIDTLKEKDTEPLHQETQQPPPAPGNAPPILGPEATPTKDVLEAPIAQSISQPPSKPDKDSALEDEIDTSIEDTDNLSSLRRTKRSRVARRLVMDEPASEE